jgi:hypothetical protein
MVQFFTNKEFFYLIIQTQQILIKVSHLLNIGFYLTVLMAQLLYPVKVSIK